MGKREKSPIEAPRFGEADLSDCEREQIHLPGSIQPHGVLLALEEEQLTVSHASTNASRMLGFGDNKSLVGWSLEAVGREVCDEVRRQISELDLAIPSVITVPLNDDHPRLFDCVLHRTDSGQLILELEPVHAADRTLSMQLTSGVDAIASTASLRSLCDVTAQLLKQVLGYNRVMVYRFGADGHGQVFAEQCDTDLEPYLGNHYPASDIPKNARELYVRNRVRMLVDVDYEPVPIEPPCDAETGERFDMSMCQFRSMSPIHLQYLRNMNVASSLVASLTVGDSLWGLIACHGSQPHQAGYTTRAAAELIAEAVGTRISALESVTRTRSELAIRRIEQSMIDVMANDGDWPKALFDHAQSVLQMLDATGAALTYDDEVTTIGSVPDHEQIRSLASWLDGNDFGTSFQTENLAERAPELSAISNDTPGVMAVPVSDDAGEYLMCFRPETVRTVTWGGDPRKTVSQSPSGQISPRQSFAQWREELQGTSVPWTQDEIESAELIGRLIRDIVHQLRAIRALIAHRQLETLSAQLKRSAIPGLIADPEGNIILANDALAQLVWQDNPPKMHLSQISRYFEEASLASHNFSELVANQKAWRGSATIDSSPILVRADPVPSPDGGVLGFVILLTDVSDGLGRTELTHRTLEGVLDEYATPTGDLPEPVRTEFDSLAAAVLDNARLAVMEISDGVDVSRVTTMLDGIEASMMRTNRLIHALAKHSAPPET